MKLEKYIHGEIIRVEHYAELYSGRSFGTMTTKKHLEILASVSQLLILSVITNFCLTTELTQLVTQLQILKLS